MYTKCWAPSCTPRPTRPWCFTAQSTPTKKRVNAILAIMRLYARPRCLSESSNTRACVCTDSSARWFRPRLPMHERATVSGRPRWINKPRSEATRLNGFLQYRLSLQWCRLFRPCPQMGVQQSHPSARRVSRFHEPYIIVVPLVNDHCRPFMFARSSHPAQG